MKTDHDDWIDSLGGTLQSWPDVELTRASNILQAEGHAIVPALRHGAVIAREQYKAPADQDKRRTPAVSSATLAMRASGVLTDDEADLASSCARR